MPSHKQSKLVKGSYSLGRIEHLKFENVELERATLVAFKRNEETGIFDIILIYTRRDNNQVVSVGKNDGTWVVQAHFDDREESLETPYKAMELEERWLVEAPTQLTI